MNALPPQAAFGGAALELGEVVSVEDPEALNRVEVKFLSRGPESEESATAMAPVAVPFAGDANGAFFIPDVGTRVVLSFLNGDPRYPVVLGALWDGAAASPEELPGNAVDRWSFTGKEGTRIAIVEESGQPVISLETPGGNSMVIEDAGGGTLTATAGGATIEISSSGVTVTGSTVSVNASSFDLTATSFNVTVPNAIFSGVVTCTTLQTTTTTSGIYTTGVGNIL